MAPCLLVTKSSPPSGGAQKYLKRKLELELELIQTQMAQKPMLRAEVDAHAMRASRNRRKEVPGLVAWSSPLLELVDIFLYELLCFLSA